MREKIIKNIKIKMQSVKKELRSLVSCKKFLVILIPIVILLSIPQITHAETPGVILRFFETVIGNSIYEALGKLLVGIGNFVLTIASLYLRICGTLFNGAMSLTLNMSEFVNNNPAINIVWRVIRDFTGIFFIFLLIWNSIKMILGKNDSGVKSLIVNIVVCGLLINFSLFFTKAIVDASNILSLSIYRAIAPGEVISVTDTSATGKISEWGKQVFNDNGIANVFMSALKIPSIYDPNYIAKDKAQKLENSGAISVYFKTAIATFMGAAIMVIAGTNFAIAAVLFLGRFAALILLMAFSPIAFLGDVFPDLSKHSKKWWSTLSGQATFAPVYLLLIYVAMKIVTDERFKAALGSNDPNVTFSAALSGNGPMGVFMQYGIVIYFITTALIVAKDMSGEAGKMSTKYGGMTAKFLHENTSSRVASKLATSETLKNFAAKSGVGQLALKGIRGAAEDYNKKLKTQVETRTKFAESLGYDENKVLAMNTEIDRLESSKAEILDKKRRAEAIIASTNSSAAEKAKATQMIASQDRAMKSTESKIKEVKENIKTTKSERQVDYRRRIESRLNNPETLFTMISRKNKKAASELQIKEKEAEKTKIDADLTEVKKDIKKLEDKKRAGQLNTPEEISYLAELTTKKNGFDEKIRKIDLEIAQHKINTRS